MPYVPEQLIVTADDLPSVIVYPQPGDSFEVYMGRGTYQLRRIDRDGNAVDEKGVNRCDAKALKSAYYDCRIRNVKLAIKKQTNMELIRSLKPGDRYTVKLNGMYEFNNVTKERIIDAYGNIRQMNGDLLATAGDVKQFGLYNEDDIITVSHRSFTLGKNNNVKELEATVERMRTNISNMESDNKRLQAEVTRLNIKLNQIRAAAI